MKKIMVGIMIKNSAKFLPKLLEEIKELTYPKNLLRLVFIYGESSDNTLQILRDEKSKNILNIEVYREPIDRELKVGGAQLAARIYSDFKRLMKDDEDYFLLLDSDLCEIPNDLIEKLIIVDADIVAPYPWSENKRHFYDSWVFRINNCRFSPQNPPGNNLTYPILVDSVGTCFLATREAWLTVPILNPYPNITFCNNARKLGYAVVAVPNIEVEHIDLELHGILHFPLSQEFGLYPNEGFIDSNFNVIPYIKKQISYESNLKMVLDQIDKTAKEQLTNNNPEFIGKSEKWAKDRVFFRTFWCTQDPYLLNLLYKTEMYPPFIEVEISNICKYNCLHCEHKFWKEKPRLMKPEEFKMIIDQFPDLKWMAFTGIGDTWANPNFLDYLKYVKSKDVYIEMYDTFQNFTDEIAKLFVELGVERLIVSLDASTEETYERIRPGHKWKKMIESIQNLDKWKKKLNKQYPEINFHFVFDKNNIHEAVNVLDFVKSLNIDNGFVMYSRLLHCFPEIEDIFMREIPTSVEIAVKERAERLNIPITWNMNLPTQLPPLNCCTALWMPFFTVDGDVITCCAQHEHNMREWEKEMKMGNIFETKDFKKIWYGSRYTQVRKLLIEDKLPECCLDCPIQDIKNKHPIKMVQG